MDTLILVESEELVRKELRNLIKKSDVEIGKIIECSSGEEALQVVKETTVDLIFTAIHMQGMDGCELAGRIAERETIGVQYKPKLVVVSSFENFQCAVELLKYGARDYILKPATFEAVDDVLHRMDSEIVREKKREQEIERIYRQHVRNLLKNGEQDHEEAWDILISAFEERRMQDSVYRLVLTNPSVEKFPAEELFYLDRVNGDLYFVQEDMLEKWLQTYSKGLCAGVSRKHSSVREIPVAYQEALEARKIAFIRGTETEIYEPREWTDGHDLHGEVERFMQLFPANKMETAKKRFRNLCFEARHQRVSPIALVDNLEELTKRLSKDYENIYSKKVGGMDCPDPMESIHVDAYTEAFEQWVSGCQSAMTEHVECVRKNDKILQAVAYIHENYQKDLNLAMVSNHVSMNYSMFSNAFKKYTGVNFVNYLKNIRIQEAKKLLEETDKKIAEIGLRVGYGNDKHFMKTFKALCGVSPSEYRRNAELMKRNATQKK